MTQARRCIPGFQAYGTLKSWPLGVCEILNLLKLQCSFLSFWLVSDLPGAFYFNIHEAAQYWVNWAGIIQVIYLHHSIFRFTNQQLTLYNDQDIVGALDSSGALEDYFCIFLLLLLFYNSVFKSL